jgi:hypothetical protein
MSSQTCPNFQSVLDALTSSTALADLGLTFEEGDRCTIVIARGGHGRGLWIATRRSCRFVPAGYATAVLEVTTAEEAVAATLDYFASQRNRRT